MLQQYLRLTHLEHPNLHLTVLRLLHVEAPDTSTVADVNDAVTPISCAPTVLKVDTPGTPKSPPNCTAPVNVEAPDTSTVADVNACSNANIMCSNST